MFTDVKVSDASLLIELLNCSYEINGKVAFVFPLYSAHYVLLSNPSKLIRMLGHQLKISVTLLSVL